MAYNPRVATTPTQHAQRTAGTSARWLVTLTCGLVFVACFWWGYSRIDPELYQARDDGVILLSHARNLVDYGFVGVNPSGGRVEGYSAPADFLLFTIVYALSHMDYRSFMLAQTWICTFLLGAVLAGFFEGPAWRPLAAALAAGIALTWLTPFLQWHGSGMENAITHVLFLAAVLTLYRFARRECIDWRWAPLLLLACLARSESVVHIAPLLLVFACYWGIRHKSLQGLWLGMLVGLGWAGYEGLRALYFGDLLPNTAYAQGIDVGANLHHLVGRDPDYLAESGNLSSMIMWAHGFPALAWPALLLPWVRRDAPFILLLLLIASLLVTASINPYLFGMSRLDPVRTTTFAAPLVVLLATSVALGARQQGHGAWMLCAALAPSLLTLYLLKEAPTKLCCPASAFETVHQTFQDIASKEHLPRPTVSNPDLGAVSWHKQFNIVDLGKLGSPLMARLKDPAALADYYFDLAAPDLVESHGVWSCLYLDTLFRDPRFHDRYRAVRERLDTGTGRCRGQQLPAGFWIRKDIAADSGSSERHLVDDLAAQLDTRRLAKELDACLARGQDNCAYVARAAYRFLPEFRAAGAIGELNRIFARSPTREFALYLVNGFRDGRAYRPVLRELEKGHPKTSPD